MKKLNSLLPPGFWIEKTRSGKRTLFLLWKRTPEGEEKIVWATWDRIEKEELKKILKKEGFNGFSLKTKQEN